MSSDLGPRQSALRFDTIRLGEGIHLRSMHYSIVKRKDLQLRHVFAFFATYRARVLNMNDENHNKKPKQEASADSHDWTCFLPVPLVTLIPSDGRISYATEQNASLGCHVPTAHDILQSYRSFGKLLESNAAWMQPLHRLAYSSYHAWQDDLHVSSYHPGEWLTIRGWWALGCA